MSSPEAHSGTPNQQNLYREHLLSPDAEAFVADGNRYAYGAEENDGDASPEVTPYDPELEADTEGAREAIHNAEGPIRHMYQNEINLALEEIKNHHKTIESRIEERQKIIDKLRLELNTKNKVGNGYKTSSNRIRWHEEKLRNLQSEKQSRDSRREVKTGNREPAHHTEGFKNLKDNLRGIDKEIERRREIMKKIENPGTNDDTRRILEQEVDRWRVNGEVPSEDQLRAILTKEAGDKYAQFIDGEKIKKFEDAHRKIGDRISTAERADIDVTTIADPDEREKAAEDQQKAIAEMTEWDESIDEYRGRLVGEDSDEFKAWAEQAAERDYSQEKNNNKRQVKQEEKDKLEPAKVAEKTALDAVNAVAENIKRLSSRGDILTDQLQKLTNQATEIKQNLGPVTDPIVKIQLQEAFDRVEKEINGTVAEQRDVTEKLKQATENKTELDEAYAEKQRETQEVINRLNAFRDELNATAEKNYLTKLRIAGL